MTSEVLTQGGGLALLNIAMLLSIAVIKITFVYMLMEMLILISLYMKTLWFSLTPSHIFVWRVL